MATTRPTDRLRLARQLSEQRERLLHTLIDTEERVAGIMPQSLLNRLYAAGRITEHEYRDLLIAQGWQPAQAHDALVDAHTRWGADIGRNLPDAIDGEPPTIYTRPGRRGKRYQGASHENE